ncbi:hypothetical protein [Neptuniibacter sp. QD37_11]|uniref:hypothetical protein n=1 Tax=Neptuniibacter sp. QD37_11 TaxID=3398209 RepID=UPI0039F49A2F
MGSMYSLGQVVFWLNELQVNAGVVVDVLAEYSEGSEFPDSFGYEVNNKGEVHSVDEHLLFKSEDAAVLNHLGGQIAAGEGEQVLSFLSSLYVEPDEDSADHLCMAISDINPDVNITYMEGRGWKLHPPMSVGM